MTLLRACAAALLATVLWGVGPSAALARTDPAVDKADIGRVEAYLNAITSLQARFLQVGPDGTSVEGTAYLLRPGRLRLDYDPPSPILVIADDGQLVYYDKELKQASYVSVDSTPAGVLVRPKVRLDGDDLKVTKVSHGPGVVAVTVAKADDQAQGDITLVFTDKPFALRKWIVRDARGDLTQVSLFDAQTDVTFDPNLFHFSDPKNQFQFRQR